MSDLHSTPFRKELLALDPGETTGWALFDMHTNEIVESGTVQGLSAVWDLMERLAPEHLTFESFFLYPGKASSKMFSSFPEIEVIGVIRLWCIHNEVCDTDRSASVAKGAYTDAMLKANDSQYWVKNRHARDAVRHGLCELQVKIRTGAKFSVND